jgi:hypothetical protein
VLEQCPALVHLDLSGNRFVGTAGAEGFAGVLSGWASAHHWLTSILAATAWKLSRKGDYELRSVVNPLVFFCWHLTMLAPRRGFEGPLKTYDLKASENTRF